MMKVLLLLAVICVQMASTVLAYRNNNYYGGDCQSGRGYGGCGGDYGRRYQGQSYSYDGPSYEGSNYNGPSYNSYNSYPSYNRDNSYNRGSSYPSYVYRRRRSGPLGTLLRNVLDIPIRLVDSLTVGSGGGDYSPSYDYNSGYAPRYESYNSGYGPSYGSYRSNGPSYRESSYSDDY